MKLEVRNEQNKKPSKRLIKSINESETIIKEIKEGKRKGYKNIKSLFEALNK